ncbi:MAG: DUF6624 domain-containing protein [Maricaulaceae bacterium]
MQIRLALAAAIGLVVASLALAQQPTSGEAVPSMDPARLEAFIDTYTDWRREVFTSPEPWRVEWRDHVRNLWQDAQAEPTAFERELGERAARDQFGRFTAFGTPGWPETLDVLGDDLTAVEEFHVGNRIIRDLRAIDADNLAWLKAAHRAHGAWWTISKIGEASAFNAWLIAQHAVADLDWMTDILAEMEALLPQGEVIPRNFALLYDRVQVQNGRLQRYGSQFQCRDGCCVISPMEDPDRVEDLRASVGLNSFADSAARFDPQPSCPWQNADNGAE